MAPVIIVPTARRDLDRIARTHQLPETTLQRFRETLEPLRQFPRMGTLVSDRTGSLRYLLGPWRWMIILYRYDEATDEVHIVAVQRRSVGPLSYPQLGRCAALTRH